MAKNIVIFSDGTGQGGGLLPDENRSNVYKLFRAARVCPDTTIDPTVQVAFYDPGLGSQAAGGGIRVSWWRRVYNILGQATGLGITQNIIDCYAAILCVWEPDDRIYLIGFSRGAYTVRCVAGVLAHCGVPTRAGSGEPLRRDHASAASVATEAVKHVYQFGSAIEGDPHRAVRKELAAHFRDRHASSAPNDPTLSNAYPYAIGVWETVAALGLRPIALLGLAVGAILLVGIFAALSSLVLSLTVLGELFDPALFWEVFWSGWAMAALVGVVAYLATYVKFTTRTSQPWYRTLHITGWRMSFYDTECNPNVQHARHALAIDENRRDFDRVPWTTGKRIATTQQKDGYTQLIQMWFAGVHSDVGGSYVENEARLSDAALKWMVDELEGLPEPMRLDHGLLHVWPGATGPQHDERKSTIDGWPAWVVGLLTLVWPRETLGWWPGVREIPADAPLHPTVLERFRAPAPGVLHYDLTQPYRPEPLRHHRDTQAFYGP